MKVLDRYIAYSVAVNTGLVLLALVGLFSFISVIEELRHVGKGNYGVLQAVQYTGLKLPGLVYQIFPMAALIGGVIGLGVLAEGNELTVMRAAGVSLARIVWSVMRIGLLLIVVNTSIGEWVVPISDGYADIQRSFALSKKIYRRGASGLWARDGLDYVNIKQILPNGALGDVQIYRYDGQHILKKTTHAKKGFYHDNNWVLEDVVISQIESDRVIITKQQNMPWDTSLSPDLLSVVTVKPETMSIIGLSRYIRFLRTNGLNSHRYELAFWSKLVAPLLMAAMIFISVPFVFGLLRSVGISHKIMMGILTGIGLTVIAQLFGYMALVYQLNPMASAIFPVTLFFLIAIVLLRRVQ